MFISRDKVLSRNANIIDSNIMFALGNIAPISINQYIVSFEYEMQRDIAVTSKRGYPITYKRKSLNNTGKMTILRQGIIDILMYTKTIVYPTLNMTSYTLAQALFSNLCDIPNSTFLVYKDVGITSKFNSIFNDTGSEALTSIEAYALTGVRFLNDRDIINDDIPQVDIDFAFLNKGSIELNLKNPFF